MQGQSWGMLTRAAESGLETLALLRQGEQFDLAILDMQMPEIDGLTLATEIRKQPGCQELPLVMLTSIGKPEISDEIAKDKIAAFLNKPIKQSQLYDVLIEVLLGQPIKVRPAFSLTSQIDRYLAERLPLSRWDFTCCSGWGIGRMWQATVWRYWKLCAASPMTWC